jgi:hypothetical protein
MDVTHTQRSAQGGRPALGVSDGEGTLPPGKGGGGAKGLCVSLYRSAALNHPSRLYAVQGASGTGLWVGHNNNPPPPPPAQPPSPPHPPHTAQPHLLRLQGFFSFNSRLLPTSLASRMAYLDSTSQHSPSQSITVRVRVTVHVHVGVCVGDGCTPRHSTAFNSSASVTQTSGNTGRVSNPLHDPSHTRTRVS